MNSVSFFRSLDGAITKVPLHKYYEVHAKKSKLHQKAKKLLQSEFPYSFIYEEVPIKIWKRKRSLKVDFFIPEQLLVVEVNGKQHFKFSPLFHQDKQAFLRQQKYDHDKKQWCSLNGFSIIDLDYNEEDNWINKIKAFKTE